MIVLALLVLAVAVGLILFAGSQPRPAPHPAPFGPAANGLVAFAADGDIVVFDPATGDERVLVGGPEVDRDPVWSPDGTRLVFERTTSQIGGRLHVVRSDGSGLTEITPETVFDIDAVSFSPDGRAVMFASGSPPDSTISVARTDGGGMRTLDVGMSATDPMYRPPDGASITFTGQGLEEEPGSYVMDADGGGLRALIAPPRELGALSLIGGSSDWSPDGTRIAIVIHDHTGYFIVRIMSADGRPTRTLLPWSRDVDFAGPVVWSNDGTRLLVARGYFRDYGVDRTLAILPVDGSGPGVETDRSLYWADVDGYRWAPDDSSILVTPRDRSGGALQPVLVDPDTAATRPAPWSADGPASWQRVTP
jgi:Tol biopolymer transport system component